ncbi:dienelactone hydrolase family protein [Herbaspirillum sp. B65]|uniref:dienelactone hydrolase family protein n=1 Tax=Herbaspirillum sp. B65 TaxID=137708 RepID=UPI002090178B|nr:dienelactone hydrolase family protein [Herbaspirillum sp. B65]
MRNWAKPLAAFCIAASLAAIGTWAQAAANSASPQPLEARRVSLTSVDDKGGKATALYGVWIKARKSSSSKGPYPTVIALHGCGGLYSIIKDGRGEFTPRHLAMARVLTDAGYNVLFPDSFTPRGRRSTCQDSVAQREISAMNRRFDVQAAMHWVTSQPDVDVKRIALLGWSHGASTLLASINLAETDVAVRKIQPRAAVAFYPDCRPYAKAGEPFKPAAPLLILMGETMTGPRPRRAKPSNKRCRAAIPKSPCACIPTPTTTSTRPACRCTYAWMSRAWASAAKASPAAATRMRATRPIAPCSTSWTPSSITEAALRIRAGQAPP